jgi:hypothetical protein
LPHIVTSHYAVPLMLGRGSGIIFEITDGHAIYCRGYISTTWKISVRRLAFAMAPRAAQQDRNKDRNKDRNSARQNDAPNDFPGVGIAQVRRPDASP